MALVPFPGPQSGAYQPELDDDEDGAAGKMSFLEHLDELRKRIVQSCLGVAVGILATFAFINHIVNFILTPTWKVLPSGSRMIYTQPGEAFGLYIQISLIMPCLVPPKNEATCLVHLNGVSNAHDQPTAMCG